MSDSATDASPAAARTRARPAEGLSPAPAATAQAAPAVESPSAAPKRRMSPAARVVMILFGVAVLATALVSGLSWWTHGRFVQSTNDAYLRADQVTVAPKVGGYVEAVYVSDNQAVAQGAPLVKIGAATFDAVVSREEAGLSARRAEVEAARKQVDQAEAGVAQARAQHFAAQVDFLYAAGDARRYDGLAAQGVETQQRADQAHSTRDRAAAAEKTAAAAIVTAQRQAETVKAQIAQASAGVEAQAAALKSAKLNLGDTLLRASVAGRIGDRSVRLGQFVQPGQRLMSVVPVSDVYLVANFKETQIAGMKIGQVARIKIDALGGKPIDAVVDSFAPGTGAQFALLPPENATGNFTKIVQRVPVRLRLRAPEALRDHLLPGLSAAVSIDTTKAPDTGR